MCGTWPGEVSRTRKRRMAHPRINNQGGAMPGSSEQEGADSAETRLRRFVNWVAMAGYRRQQCMRCLPKSHWRLLPPLGCCQSLLLPPIRAVRNSLQDGSPTRSALEGDPSANTYGAVNVESKWQHSKVPANCCCCQLLVLRLRQRIPLRCCRTLQKALGFQS